MVTGLALIGGTGLLHSEWGARAVRREVVTPYGEVTLLDAGGWYYLQRHGLDGYTPPHRINRLAQLAALQQLGVERILAVGSVGSLRLELPPGSLVVPDDFYAPQMVTSFFDDQRGHRTPGFDPQWRREVITRWQSLALPPLVDGGVYWQTVGPRFETPAEVRFHAPFCQVVGMTVATECALAGELSIPYAALCMVDNYANGIQPDLLTLEGFYQQVAVHREGLVDAITRWLFS